MTFRTLICLAVGCLASCQLAATGRAQTIGYPDPSLYAVYPAGAQRGTTVTVELRGQGGLRGASGVVVEGPHGVTVKKVEPINVGLVKATLAVADDAPLGRRRLRVLGGENGLTSFRYFFVGPLKEVFEEEPNNGSPENVQMVTTPVVVNGQVNPKLDQDCYRFQATAGQKIVAAVLAHGMDSHAGYRQGFLDASLELLDDSGNVMATAEDTLGLDPLIHVAIPKDGAYTVRLTTLGYEGSTYAVYRLTLGEVPYPTAAFPPGGRRGETIDVELSGPNIPPGTRHSVKLDVAGTYPLSFLTEAACGVELPLTVGELREVVEKEPNGDRDAAMPLAVSTTANGRFLKAGDEDWYRLTLKKGEGVLLSVVAQRHLRSPVDAILEVYDSTGKKLAENDDGAALYYQVHGDYPSLDSRLEFTAPADGAYFIRMRNQNSEAGPRAVYRLAVEPRRPDFWLFQWPDAVPIWGAGGTASFIVEAQHWGGLNSDIELRIEGLPKGWKGSTANIPWSRFADYGNGRLCDKYLLTITAPPDAKRGDTVRFRVFGRAKQDGRVIEHEARYLTLYGNSHSDRMHLRDSPGAWAAVAPLLDSRIETKVKQLTVRPGETVEIPVAIYRHVDKKAKTQPQIGLVVNGPTVAAGCGWMAPVNVPAHVNQFRVPLHVRPDWRPGIYSIVVARSWSSDIRAGRPGPCTPLIQLHVLPSKETAK